MTDGNKCIKPFSTAYQSERVKLSDAIPLEIPLCISLEPTALCNFKCLMCWQSMDEFREKGGPFKNMTQKVFDKAVNDIVDMCVTSKHKIKLIKFYHAGEPLLHPYIGDMVRTIVKADVADQTEVTSNASLLTHELARDFVDNGLDYFRASIYSVLFENQKRISHTDITPEQILNNIAYMRKYRDSQGKCKPYISAKIIDTHSTENDRFKAMYKGVSDEQWVDIPWDLACTKEKALDRLYGGTVGGLEAREEYRDTSLYKHRKACRYPFTHLIIKANGDVIICCMDWQRATFIGNIMQESLINIWNGKKLYDFRVMQLKTHGVNHPLCASCELPLRDCPEDNIDDVSVSCLHYKK